MLKQRNGLAGLAISLCTVLREKRLVVWFGKVVIASSDIAVQLVDVLPLRILTELKKLSLWTWEVTENSQTPKELYVFCKAMVLCGMTAIMWQCVRSDC